MLPFAVTNTAFWRRRVCCDISNVTRQRPPWPVCQALTNDLFATQLFSSSHLPQRGPSPLPPAMSLPPLLSTHFHAASGNTTLPQFKKLFAISLVPCISNDLIRSFSVPAVPLRIKNSWAPDIISSLSSLQAAIRGSTARGSLKSPRGRTTKKQSSMDFPSPVATASFFGQVYRETVLTCPSKLEPLVDIVDQLFMVGF